MISLLEKENPVDKEQNYWEKRYAAGRTSGLSPEKAKERNRKLWLAIERELPEVNHIIDVGCGDLRIWGDRGCEDYVGTDIVMSILQQNKTRHPNWKFVHVPAEVFIANLTRENVFCFNMFFHILSAANLNRIVRNLCRYATGRIFVYTWIRNPLAPRVTDGKYQHYHPMGRLLPRFNKEGFELASVEHIEDPSALYIFRKQKMSPLELFPRI